MLGRGGAERLSSREAEPLPNISFFAQGRPSWAFG